MDRFDYFVICAEMRTGSNLLEANINRFADLHCLGEAFNPSFIGYPKSDDMLGLTLEDREKSPEDLIAVVKAADGLCGFRFFSDHDRRAADICLPDPRCAKIVLTRNPVDSFVSWKIARATGQWKLTNATHAKSEQVHFNGTEFATYLSRLQGFQRHLLRVLQSTGQTAFYLSYDDLNDLEILNGLARFLGIDEQLQGLDRKLKKQNPAPAIEKVTNPDEMISALSKVDHFNLGQTPNFEPRRGPLIPSYLAAPDSPLLYMPLRTGLDGAIAAWLAQLDGKPEAALRKGFTQKTLRDWKKDHPGFRSFAVVRHPVARAHHAFCEHILFDGPRLFLKIRQTLRKVHRLPIPAEPLSQHQLNDYDIEAHRTAFLAFAQFVQSNLSAQTAIRTDPAWASQLAILQGMADFGMPDVIAREARIEQDLAHLCEAVGQRAQPAPVQVRSVETDLLAEIYDPSVEKAWRSAYQRDYTAFGFGDWQPVER